MISSAAAAKLAASNQEAMAKQVQRFASKPRKRLTLITEMFRCILSSLLAIERLSTRLNYCYAPACTSVWRQQHGSQAALFIIIPFQNDAWQSRHYRRLGYSGLRLSRSLTLY